MSYTVLARRYRSKDFDDLIGQEPIAQTLRNAIESNRVAHAYLFCGTRGVGKTSMARILAKALNCVNGPTAKPCGVCDRCRAIAAGEDIDVVEIDGASNRGIDEIRNLRSNVIYRPARSPYKIYIIDEVHMLTKEAFNALLKTLEEPPSHVKFIFATTEAHRVPATITSRCQEFQFRLIPTAEIARRLAEILQAEKIDASAEVIDRVARAGRGSMRDALSLMDQLLSMGAERIAEAQVDYLLGEPSADQMIELADALADNDPAAVLTRADALLASGQAPEQFVATLIEHVRRLMLLSVIGPDCAFLDVTATERQPLARQAGRFNPMTLVYTVQLLDQLRQSVRSSGTAARALIDAALVRLALLERFADTAELLDRLEGVPTESAERAAPGDAKKKFPVQAVAAVDRPAPGGRAEFSAGGEAGSGAAVGSADAPAGPAPASPDVGPALVAADVQLDALPPERLWADLVGRIRQARLVTLSGPLALARLESVEGGSLRLAARPDMIRLLSAPQRQRQLESVLGRLLDRPVKVEWVGCQAPADVTNGSFSAGESSGAGNGEPATLRSTPNQQQINHLLNDAVVRDVMDLFGATVIGVDRKSGDGASPSA